MDRACSRRKLVAEAPSFYATSAWWFLAALSRGMLEVLGREWLAKLSLSVFAQRANYAYQVRRAIENSDVVDSWNHACTSTFCRGLALRTHHDMASFVTYERGWMTSLVTSLMCQANRTVRRVFNAAWVVEERRRIDRENERQRKRKQLKQAALALKRAARRDSETQLALVGATSPNQSALPGPKLWKVVKKAIKQSGSKDGTLPSLPSSTLPEQDGPWASHRRASSGPALSQPPTPPLDGASSVRVCSSEPHLPQAPASSPQVLLAADVAAAPPAAAAPSAAPAARDGGTSSLADAGVAGRSGSSALERSRCVADDSDAKRNTVNDHGCCGVLGLGQRPPTPRRPRLQNSSATADVIAATFPGLQSVQNTLIRLAGPLSFGTAFTEASTLTQASNRARRVFRMIIEEKELLMPSDETDRHVIDVKAMVCMLEVPKTVPSSPPPPPLSATSATLVI